jgi:hypothetical protein
VIRTRVDPHARVSSRARTREDRAGDPLDGLVNLFDLGIVLSVAFLLAALSSLDLTGALFKDQGAQPGSVVVQPDETSRTIDLQPGAKVVGKGEPVGTVYRLDDGREILVEPEGATTTPNGAPTSPGTTPQSGNGTTTEGEPSLGTPDIGTDGSQ